MSAYRGRQLLRWSLEEMSGETNGTLRFSESVSVSENERHRRSVCCAVRRWHVAKQAHRRMPEGVE